MILKSAILKVSLLLALVVLVLVIIFIIFSKTSLEVEITNMSTASLQPLDLVRIEKNYTQDFGISEEECYNIINHPDDYKFIIYSLKLRNKSKFKQIRSIEFEPICSNAIKKSIISNVDSAFPLGLKPLEGISFNKYILIKVNGKSDKDIMNFAKEVKFMASGSQEIFGELQINNFKSMVND